MATITDKALKNRDLFGIIGDVKWFQFVKFVSDNGETKVTPCKKECVGIVAVKNDDAGIAEVVYPPFVLEIEDYDNLAQYEPGMVLYLTADGKLTTTNDDSEVVGRVIQLKNGYLKAYLNF